MAIAYRKPIVLVAEDEKVLFGEYGYPPVFYRHPNVHLAHNLKEAKYLASTLWTMYGDPRGAR